MVAPMSNSRKSLLVYFVTPVLASIMLDSVGIKTLSSEIKYRLSSAALEFFVNNKEEVNRKYNRMITKFLFTDSVKSFSVSEIVNKYLLS